MSPEATQLAGLLLLPPAAPLLLLAAGLTLRTRHPRLAMTLILAATFVLFVPALPVTAAWLQKTLEIAPPVAPQALGDAQAIVILGAGRRLDAPEYGGDTPSALALERLRYGAHLARASGLPLLVTGGKPGGGTESEAHLMARLLREEYGLAARWIEPHARTTWENAHNSAGLLRADGIDRIVLVSHAWHLRRAVPRFEAEGLAVLPAGTQFARVEVRRLADLVPNARALADSSHALREWLGILWYNLRTLTA